MVVKRTRNNPHADDHQSLRDYLIVRVSTELIANFVRRPVYYLNYIPGLTVQCVLPIKTQSVQLSYPWTQLDRSRHGRQDGRTLDLRRKEISIFTCNE